MKAVVLLSGGMDSTVLLASLASDTANEVHAVSVLYGQRHAKEIDAAKAVARHYALVHHGRHQVLDLRAIGSIFAGSALTSKDVAVPLGHYAEEAMKATVVPNRNMVLLSLATAYAVSIKAQWVAYAAHAGDHAIYPDCRPEFATYMAAAIEHCDWHKVGLHRPFLQIDKAEIVRRGMALKVPFGLTWSCYQGLQYHCGECGTCVERKEAFAKAGVEDPTSYVRLVDQKTRYEPTGGYSAP